MSHQHKIYIAISLLNLFPLQLEASNEFFPDTRISIFTRLRAARHTAIECFNGRRSAQAVVYYAWRVTQRDDTLAKVSAPMAHVRFALTSLQILAPFLSYLLRLAIGPELLAALPEDTNLIAPLVDCLVRVICQGEPVVKVGRSVPRATRRTLTIAPFVSMQQMAKPTRSITTVSRHGTLDRVEISAVRHISLSLYLKLADSGLSQRAESPPKLG